MDFGRVLGRFRGAIEIDFSWILRAISQAQISLNLSKLASCRPRRRASEPRSGVARCSGSSAQGSLNSPNSYRSPVRKNAADIQKVQTHLNNHALPVPLPSQVFLGGHFFIQDASKTPQDAPRRSQDASKRPQDAPKTPQEAPKMRQDAPRRPRDAPRCPPGSLQEAPRRFQDAQEAPKRPQEASRSP